MAKTLKGYLGEYIDGETEALSRKLDSARQMDSFGEEEGHWFVRIGWWAPEDAPSRDFCYSGSLEDAIRGACEGIEQPTSCDVSAVLDPRTIIPIPQEFYAQYDPSKDEL